MRRIPTVRTQSLAELTLLGVGLPLALLLSLASPALADRRADAREQFARAVKMRTALEGEPQKDRTLGAYKQAIAAYHKVYLITSQAEEVTPSLIAEAELYREMGRQFDEKYSQAAINTYNFLLKQYPGSRYRGQALFSIGQIQQEDLNQPEAAEAILKEYLKRFPHSQKSNEAREVLKEIADARGKNLDQESAVQGPVAEQRESARGIPRVTDIRTWNADNYVRVVVTLEDTIKYDSARISSPDRVYFDLYKARLNPALAKKTLNVDSGLLRSIRIAQNKQGVVRLVLDVNSAKDYSAYLLANPYRLVIDVHSPAANTSTGSLSSPAVPAKTAAEKPAGSGAGNASGTVSGTSETVQPPPSGPSAGSASGKAAANTKSGATTAILRSPTLPKPTRDGQLPLTRALGLKISRIVIDPGHGGHDTGTIGPHGLMEKDLCLDVALRLGRLIEEKLPGAEVVFTRKDDTFVPLEDRTGLANQAKADLFISIHANSSHDHAARGVETYYLNFATSPESMEVAARENALSQESLHDLQDLIKKIARNEKMEESKELATDIQDALAQRLQLVSHGEKNRGVKKAPFVVLIGANMPSVLSEISFVSNPYDERLLRRGDQRQRIADGLYHGISNYLGSLNSLSYDKSKLVSDNHPPASTVASEENPK